MSTSVAVFGTGYLGATHAACMAELGHQVLGVDVDESKLAKLEAGEFRSTSPGSKRCCSATLRLAGFDSRRPTRKLRNSRTSTSLVSEHPRRRANSPLTWCMWTQLWIGSRRS